MRVLPVLLAGLLVAAWTQAAVASISADPQQQQKPQVPTKATAPAKTPEKGRSAATPAKKSDKKDEKASAGQGARAGIGQFDFISPDAPPLRPGANVGKRLLGSDPQQQQQKPPATKTTAPAKTPEKGRSAATPAKKSDKKDEKASAGQGARAGIGQFDFISPDAPPLRPGANVGKRLLADPQQQQQKPQMPPAKTEKATKQTGNKAQKKKDEKATAGQGARSGIGQFDFISPDKPTLAPGGNVATSG